MGKERRIVLKWDDDAAKRYFQLEQFVAYDPDHSCYGCFDDWPRNRKKCPANKDHWEYVSRGDIAWAKRINKHYELGQVL